MYTINRENVAHRAGSTCAMPARVAVSTPRNPAISLLYRLLPRMDDSSAAPSSFAAIA